jgi:hypothetical protein
MVGLKKLYIPSLKKETELNEGITKLKLTMIHTYKKSLIKVKLQGLMTEPEANSLFTSTQPRNISNMSFLKRFLSLVAFVLLLSSNS